LKFEKRGDKDFLILGLNKLVVFNIIVSAGSVMGV
jgi:hypothetical protein